MLQALVLTLALLVAVFAGESVTLVVQRWMRHRGRV
jgi:hypothetical protein